MNQAYIARLRLNDCALAAPRGALKLIKGTRTFTQHLESGGKRQQNILLLSIKHLSCVFHGMVCVFLVTLFYLI